MRWSGARPSSRRSRSRRRASPIGRETVSALQAGIVFGAVGQTEGIVTRMRRELGDGARVIASGGLAPIVARETDAIERVEPHLVLYGLRADWLRRQA